MSNRLTKIFMAAALSLGAIASLADDTTPNLVKDGGMEVWKEIGPEESLYYYNKLKKLQVSFTDEGKILKPSAYEQGGISVVQRESDDVYSGNYSLRLKSSRFYFFSAAGPAYTDVRQGDIYVVRFMAKGSGNARMRLEVYKNRTHIGRGYTLELRGKPIPDKWTPIEQRILVGQTSPDKIYPGLEATGEMLIDDVFVGRVLRKDEQTGAKKVPKEYDTRIAFASAATRAPAIDGRLDDAGWKAATVFSGFRLAHEQTLLAPQQASFRVLSDESAIYLGIEIILPDAQRIRGELGVPSREDKAGDVYTDQHSVEVFIQPPGQARYVQYVVSLNGCQWDGVGMDKTWNGQWQHAVSAGDDRWFLEVMIPAADVKLQKITAAEGWRLNVVDNKDGNYATWSAVGNNYHTPFAFGSLATRDFPSWCAAKLQGWTAQRAKAAAQADQLGLMVADRLEQADKFTRGLPQTPAGEQADWKTVTRTYALMNFVDTVYRVMNAEMQYASWFAEE